jgi:hypothetical protein
MLGDDDELGHQLAMSFMSQAPWILIVFALLVAVVVAWACIFEDSACQNQRCVQGEPMLIKHECVCVSRPDDPLR